MKFSCTWVLLCFLPFFAIAQREIPTTDLGLSVDPNGKIVWNYLDMEYSPTAQLEVLYNWGNELASGYIIEQVTGKRVDAFFKRASGSWLPVAFIKKPGNGLNAPLKKANQITNSPLKPTQIKIVRVGFDSLISRDNFQKRSVAPRGSIKAKNQFARVLEYFNGATFFELEKGRKSTYLIQREGNDFYSDLDLASLDYREGLADLVKAAYDTDTSKQARRLREYLYRTGKEFATTQLISIAKYHYAARTGRRIYFNASWRENRGFDSTRHYYYATISPLHDVALELRYFTKSGTLLSSKVITRIGSGGFVDTETYYFPSGKIRKHLTYRDGKRDKCVLYYPDGDKQYVMSYRDTTRKSYVALIKYTEVYDQGGKMILDNRGDGKVLYFDSVQMKEFQLLYNKYRLEGIAYMKDKKQYFLLSEYQPEPLNKLQKMIREVPFPKELAEYEEEYYFLFRLAIHNTGKVLNVETLKGGELPEASQLVSILTNGRWSPAYQKATAINAEILVPVYFRTGWPTAEGYYYNPALHYPQFQYTPVSIPKPPVILR